MGNLFGNIMNRNCGMMKFTAIFLTIAMVVCMMPLSVSYASDPDSNPDWVALQTAFSDGTATTDVVEVTDTDGVRTVKLLKDIKAGASDVALQPSGGTILDLNGHVLDRGFLDDSVGGSTTSAINCTGLSAATLFNIIDSTPSTVHHYTSESGIWKINYTGEGTVINGGIITGGRSCAIDAGQTNCTMYGGTICGNISGNGGGIVFGSNGQFTLSGGAICGNKSTGQGGGVMSWSSPITINAGTISHNISAGYGGGVTANGLFSINGGNITYNTSTSNSGGGVYAYSTFIMDGGTISYNESPQGGGGVYAVGAVTINDGEISHNTAANNGGGIFATSTVDMTGGTVSYNAVTSTVGHAGGIFANGAMTMSGGAITNNTSARKGGGVHAVASLTMTGGEISGNHAGGDGGGGISMKDAEVVLTFGGTAKVDGNTSSMGGIACKDDTYLLNGATIKVSESVPLETGAKIGVTTLYSATNAFGEGKGASTLITGLTDGNMGYFSMTNSGSDDHGVVYNITKSGDNYVIEGTYAIILTASGSAMGSPTASPSTAKAGTSVTLNPRASTGYIFVSWDSSDVSISSNTFTMPATNVAITAVYEVDDTPGPGPGPSGGGDKTTKVTMTGEGDKVEISASVSGNTATVKDISKEEIEKVVGDEGKGGVVEIDLSGLNNVSSAKLPTAAVEMIAEAGQDTAGMAVKLSTATLTFDAKATQEIADQAKGQQIELVVDSIKNTSLNAVQKEAVGNKDVAIIIDAYLTSGGNKICTEAKNGFAGGKATLALSYKIKENRNPENYSVFYLDDNGRLEKLNAKYDTAKGCFVFDIYHFSNYVVTYDENAVAGMECAKDASCPASVFTDIDITKWYHDGIHYCVEKGMMQGGSATTFSPNRTLSRAELVTTLYRLAGSPEMTSYSRYYDVQAWKWYGSAVNWADENGLVKGIGGGYFVPNGAVTREQLACILYRYAEANGQATANQMTVLPCKDSAQVSSYATEAVFWCYQKGIITGKEDGNFYPQGYATRAEAAAMLQRFCEL